MIDTSRGVVWNGFIPMFEYRNKKKQNVIDVKRIIIRKLTLMIDTNIFVFTFNNPKSLPEIKIGYILAKVEKYIPNPRRYNICQKYGCLKEVCSRKPVNNQITKNRNRIDKPNK